MYFLLTRTLEMLQKVILLFFISLLDACTFYQHFLEAILGPLESCAHAASGKLYPNRVAGNNGYACICSCSAPLSLWISFTRHSLKDKIIMNFKSATAEH